MVTHLKTQTKPQTTPKHGVPAPLRFNKGHRLPGCVLRIGPSCLKGKFLLVWGGELLHRRVREAAPDHLYLLLVGAPALLLPGRPDPPVIVLGWARDERASTVLSTQGEPRGESSPGRRGQISQEETARGEGSWDDPSFRPAGFCSKNFYTLWLPDSWDCFAI